MGVILKLGLVTLHQVRTLQIHPKWRDLKFSMPCRRRKTFWNLPLCSYFWYSFVRVEWHFYFHIRCPGSPRKWTSRLL